MRRHKPMRLAAAAVGLTVLIVALPSAIASQGKTGYEPHLNPANFSTHITNRYFPLPVGRTLVYRGFADGHRQVDKVHVTNQTIMTAEGVRARVVHDDVRTPRGLVLEQTSDYYAQSKSGAVWYFGENSVEYKNGKPDRSGSWMAGRNDAEPGILMFAHPHVPQAARQEYARGNAEDTGWIVQTGARTRVPVGIYHHVVIALEYAANEPGIVSEKRYARGVGMIFEHSLHGEHEIGRLVRVTGGY